MTSLARINPDGSLYLPAKMLEHLGIKAGAEVTLEETPGGITIRLSRDEEFRRVQDWTRAVLKNAEVNSVDAFIAERRREAERE